ncbi:hypothetical protein SDC9_212986 [bioreactor metagenome]|uniref:Uncharacterized protein n=1 Tax=bioreactor metagenome TaxID=1076179 RepID=A0A645JPF8_9ZZZZ
MAVAQHFQHQIRQRQKAQHLRTERAHRCAHRKRKHRNAQQIDREHRRGQGQRAPHVICPNQNARRKQHHAKPLRTQHAVDAHAQLLCAQKQQTEHHHVEPHVHHRKARAIRTRRRIGRQ